MGAVTHGSQAVESGCVLAGDVPVGNAAGDPFLEFHSESPSRLARGVPELAISWGGCQRWHIHRALDSDPGSGDGGPDAAIDLSHVHGDPALGIIEGLK